MSLNHHAVVWLDHHNANILQFDAAHVESEKIKATNHYTRQHGSAVRSEHEFYAEVCDALAGVSEVLVTGSTVVQGDFRHYLDKHRPQTAHQVVGFETVDHPSERQLVALARQYFLKRERMVGTPGMPGTP